MHAGAVFDRTGTYRYLLWRVWDAAARRVAFVMLNPSTADATRDDPTIRRCTILAHRWGFGSLLVVNLFAYQATDPAAIRRAADPIGRLNDRFILAAARAADLVIAAWGNAGALRGRDRAVGALLSDCCSPACLGLTKAG